MLGLATLRCKHVGKKSQESKQGAPVYDGTPAGFFEWEFRVMARYHATDDDDEAGQQITEGLTGESLKVAISLGLVELAKKEGEHIFPLGSAEARELFKAGLRPGILSKQSGETMISYISRRRRWYDMPRNLDKAIQLSDQVRGDLLLDHANLSLNEKLMIMTSTFNDFWSSNMRLHTRSKLLIEE